MFKEIRKQIFLKMIEDDRVTLNKRLQTISDTLSEASQLYKSCLILPKFTIDIDNQIGVYQDKLPSISQSFDPIVTLTRSIEGQIIALNDQISSLQVDKEKVLRKVDELENLISIQLDTMLSNKEDCMKKISQPISSSLRELEIHATVLNEFITILDILKSG